jgi:hypothetical protein
MVLIYLILFDVFLLMIYFLFHVLSIIVDFPVFYYRVDFYLLNYLFSAFIEPFRSDSIIVNNLEYLHTKERKFIIFNMHYKNIR